MTWSTPRNAITLGAIAALSTAVSAQTFYDMPITAPLDQSGKPDTDAALREMSLLYIDVPQPEPFEVHDLVTIIIDESSTAESKQSLDTKKEYDLSAGLTEFPSLRHLLELQLESGDSSPIAGVGINGEHEFKGEGQAKRSDRFVARITAEIIDVKPNGTLVLEARKSVAQGKESKMIVLSGTCRQEDITNVNTINSSQLADLQLVQTTEGDVAKASKKGFIPRLFEAVFAF